MVSLSDIEKVVHATFDGVTKVELWGSLVAVFVRDFGEYYQNREKIRELANALKKKIVVRGDPKKRKEPERTAELIKSLASDAGITNIWFEPQFGEVHIEAYKPGLVIGKQGSNLKQIARESGWSPVVLRTPTMPSFTIEGVRKSDISNAEDRKKFLTKIGKKLLKPTPETSWVRAAMLGAFRQVGRSSVLIQTKNSRVLIDAGVQTGLNPATASPEDLYPYINMLGFPINELDAVIISHAHMDHTGFLPFLFAAGYD
ncbi:MAG: MBL fold metallo-hydrolase, partial [Methanobacteriota archaeon]